jgi:hypothetical protein
MEVKRTPKTIVAALNGSHFAHRFGHRGHAGRPREHPRGLQPWLLRIAGGPHYLQPDLVESIEEGEAGTFDRLRQCPGIGAVAVGTCARPLSVPRKPRPQRIVAARMEDHDVELGAAPSIWRSTRRALRI